MHQENSSKNPENPDSEGRNWLNENRDISSLPKEELYDLTKTRSFRTASAIMHIVKMGLSIKDQPGWFSKSEAMDYMIKNRLDQGFPYSYASDPQEGFTREEIYRTIDYMSLAGMLVIRTDRSDGTPKIKFAASTFVIPIK